jgi:transcriptional regulator with XRE-family HTH domain
METEYAEVALKKQLGEHIRALRNARGWSLSFLANRAGISKPYLYQLEDGRGNPSIVYITRIAAALGVSFDDLMQSTKPIIANSKVTNTKSDDYELKESDSGIGFWALLCKRAATVQRVYQYDGNLSFNNQFQRVLGEYDWVFRKLQPHNDCARRAQEAIKREDAAWKGNKNPTSKELNDIAKIWEDASSKAEEGENPYEKLAVYWSLGNALYAPNSYHYRKALDAFSKALTLVISAGLEIEDEAGFFTTLGWVSYYAGEYSQAIEFFQNSIQKWQDSNRLLIKEYGLAGVYRGLGSTYQRILQTNAAKEAFDTMLIYANELSGKGESKLQLIWGECRFGSFYKFIGDLHEADRHLATADRLWHEFSQMRGHDRGMQSIRTMILNNRADLLIRRGIDHDEAQKYLEESIEIAEEIPDKRSQAYSYWFLSLLHMDSQEWDKVIWSLEKSNKLFHEMTIPHYEYAILLSKARVYCALGAPLTAQWLINDSIEEQTEDIPLKILISTTRAYVCANNHEYEDAIRLFDENIPLLSDLKYELATVQLDYANVLLENKLYDKAQDYLDRSCLLCDQFGYQALTKEIDNTHEKLNRSRQN